MNVFREFKSTVTVLYHKTVDESSGKGKGAEYQRCYLRHYRIQTLYSMSVSNNPKPILFT